MESIIQNKPHSSLAQQCGDFVRMLGTAAWHRPHIYSINLAMFPIKKITFVSLYVYMSSGTHELLAKTQICTAMLSRPCFVCFFFCLPNEFTGMAGSFLLQAHPKPITMQMFPQRRSRIPGESCLLAFPFISMAFVRLAQLTLRREFDSQVI